MAKMLGWDRMTPEERADARRRGGKKSAKKLTRAQRVARARKAVKARWGR